MPVRTMKMNRNGTVAAFALLLISHFCVDAAKVEGGEAGKRYNLHDPVEIIVNIVRPFNNPRETYRYYSFPFCEKSSTKEEEEEPAQEENAKVNRLAEEARVGATEHLQRLGELIVGDRRETSPFEITFSDSVGLRLLCEKTLSSDELKKFKDAIHNNYIFEMFVEDLPMWGHFGDFQNENIVMGEVEGSHTYLFPHLHFTLETNDNQIVAAKVTTDMDRKVDITKVDNELKVQFSYSVEFKASDLNLRERMSRYAESRFLPTSFEIHWLSIVNSFVLVLLLTAFLTILLRSILKNHDAMDKEEFRWKLIDVDVSSRWKLIDGDVFRFPEHSGVFCAAVGTGNQLIVLALVQLGLAVTGIISTTRRGSIVAGVVVLYCLTSIVGGYTSIRLYRQMTGKNWVRCVLITALLFPAPVVAVFVWVNTVAISRGSTSALPFAAILTITELYMFISFPLTVVGGILAKNYANAEFNAPTRTTSVAHEIPKEIPWYQGRVPQGLIAGFLPFSVIYVELHYVLASMWGHKINPFFGILLLVFILLLIATSFNTVALLYYQLAREDHRWWWATYINGGMTGVFIYFYSFHYFFHRSQMGGMLQGSFYFGYMAVISFAFFLMLGSVGFQSSLVFVKYIYSRVKCE